LNIEDFIITVEPQYQGFALAMHEYLMQEGCKLKITSAKNGYVISYQHGAKKRVVMNFVFRKSGLVARVYGDHATEYLDFLETMPEIMKKAINKAPSCKRFDDPPKCSSKCIGYVFTLGGATFQKCRYNCFMFEVSDESIPFIREHIEKELQARAA